MIDLMPLATRPVAAVESLLDRAFGADRRARTAYKVRGGAHAIDTLSFAAVEAGELIGSIQCWPVTLIADEGGDWPLVMIGPVAVDPGHQRNKIGRRLMTHAIAAAAETGLDQAMTLIGDPEYYGRFFSFSAERTGAWRLPGPVERRRLLARGDEVPAVAGALGPRSMAAA